MGLRYHGRKFTNRCPTDTILYMRRMAATDAIVSFLCMEVVNGEKASLEDPVDDLESLLDSFKDVFHKPSGLPPSRVQDHAIHLNPGAQAVNVKPYRYPYFQNQVMEQLVDVILREEVIRTNTSPFSSPVLLVSRKDGTWRFCVDYRALNALTIRNHFPFPTVDELFDELNGAQFFSKVDLLSGYNQIRVRR